jgi:hypothetical protein
MTGPILPERAADIPTFPTTNGKPWLFVVFVQRFLRWAVWSFFDMST